MLHIHNGDSTAGTLRDFGFPGEHKAFHEALMDGPTPSNLSGDEWLNLRAGFLGSYWAGDVDECAQDLFEEQQWLNRYTAQDEVVLWFEHDLFCQINLIYLLDWFSTRRSSSTRLSLICIGSFPGQPDFRGLGELTGEQLASLFDTRHEVTDAEFSLASKAWAAYRSSNPEQIESLVKEDTSALPFLRDALRLHLMRFPSPENGLGHVENVALKIIATGSSRFKSLFPHFARTVPSYGMGDAQLWSALRRLGIGNDPLIKMERPKIAAGMEASAYHDFVFEATDFGREVLDGKRDFIQSNGIDLWLGGVHLDGAVLWRRDDHNQLAAQKRKDEPRFG